MSLSFSASPVIICDDLRIENNGKPILIGVYSGEIVIPTFPVTLILNFYVQGRLPAHTPLSELALKIDLDAQQIALGNVSIENPADEDTDGVIVLRASLMIPTPSTMTFSVQDGGEWHQLATKRIRQAPVTASATAP
jgi:hypothetical protein